MPPLAQLSRQLGARGSLAAQLRAHGGLAWKLRARRDLTTELETVLFLPLHLLLNLLMKKKVSKKVKFKYFRIGYLWLFRFLKNLGVNELIMDNASYRKSLLPKLDTNLFVKKTMRVHDLQYLLTFF